MTKHLEERLSEALDTAARTVPDNAVPPELFPAEGGRTTAATERRWVPVLAIGLAMAAVVVAVAIPIAVSRNNSAPPASSVCPAPPAVQELPFGKQNYTDPDYADLNKLPFGPSPRVPFTMAKDADLDGGYLEDRGVRVPLASGSQVYSIGRVECGWAAYRQSGKSGDAAEVGVLSTDGKYRSFGLVTGDGASLSPDGSQLAYVALLGKAKASVVTVSVVTGKQLAAVPAGVNSEVVGWNSHGVWFMPDRDKYVTQVWTPGGKPVAVDTDEHQLTAYRGTDRMLLTDQDATPAGTGQPEPGGTPSQCVRVVALDSAYKLATVLEKCGGAAGTLSPDGRVLVTDADGIVQAYLIGEGTEPRLRMSSMLVTVDHETVWEDATHLLNSAGLRTDRQVTVRCDVMSGACERIQDGPQEGAPVGPELGYP
ncbi:hypothetical protein [Streptomyces sp. SID13031]|uniref:hypothetical protein n=1 Tax=Streptomyces sp. SID13031 TaxID=2706046 RepID=UPI0013C5F2A8|nr:hypothetical protein [Streptomyces sp. SID13031]NEA35792.1 hypothetical protein [Streptomyces sp. SID13031]